MVTRSAIVAAALVCLGAATAQAQQSGATAPAGLTTVTVPAVAWGSRSGETRLPFKGTSLMPGASGSARVERQGTSIKVSSTFTGLQNPVTFGQEYLTYVMWAITPDGRVFNFNEIGLPPDRDAWTTQGPGNRTSLNIVTPIQGFGLMVTAEPYYMVRTPSRMVVLQGSFEGVANAPDAVDVRVDLAAQRGYEPTGFNFDAVLLRANLPLDFFQARNAVRIAEAAGAEQHASAAYAHATTQMRHAEELAGERRIDRRALIVASREAIQAAEDARQMASRGADARRVQVEAERAASADAERVAAERRRDEADRESREAMARAQEALRAQAAAEQRQEVAQQQQQQAEAEAARTRAAAADLDRRLQQAIRDREDLRASLLQQLNVILETRDTARGLVVNLSDVTFASGQSALQPGAREKLARVSGILTAHPTLRLEIEGHTDSVGSDDMNQTLSERRAQAVRSYLIQQGVPASSTSAAGFGKARPVATNDTPQGRQLNRRVELVVSGEAIGAQRP